MNTLILNQQQVSELLTMEECMMVMDKAFLALSAGDVLLPLRQVVWLPGGKSALAVMPSFSGDIQAMGVKVISVFPENLGTGMDSHQGAVLLFDAANGCLRAIIDATEITAIRTAAVSGIATRALSRPDACDLAILGSGVQARTHLQAMLIARKIKRIRVWSRNPDHAEQFAQREGEQHTIAIEVCKSAAEAVSGADIICTVTAAKSPVLKGEWLREGVHINAIGTFGPSTREVDSAVVARSLLFVDRKESAVNEAGDYLIPLKEGSIGPDHIRGELADVLSGKVAGRNSPEDITLFKSLGLAVEDLASAHYLYEKAVEKQIGTFVELGGLRHDS